MYKRYEQIESDLEGTRDQMIEKASEIAKERGIGFSEAFDLVIDKNVDNLWSRHYSLSSEREQMERRYAKPGRHSVSYEIAERAKELSEKTGLSLEQATTAVLEKDLVLKQKYYESWRGR